MPEIAVLAARAPASAHIASMNRAWNALGRRDSFREHDQHSTLKLPALRVESSSA